VDALEALENRIPVDAGGLYMLSRYELQGPHSLDLGVRLDYNSLLKRASPTFRGGYVGSFLQRVASKGGGKTVVERELILKLLYGQAIQEPPARLLFGDLGETGSRDLAGTGSNELLRPERSQTLEGALVYNQSWFSLNGSVYFVRYQDAIITKESKGSNVGTRRMAGADLGATALLTDLFPQVNLRQLRVWAYYSTYFQAKEAEFDNPSSVVDIGDLARHKVWGGATVEVNRSLGATALGRCIGTRVPVRSNPLGPVPGYCVVDANLHLQHLFVEGLSLNVRGSNLLDTRYSHPGIREANSGNFPGRWEGTLWVGSEGPYNSQLPQPGRAISVQLGFEL
jgi:outer membrane receptor protein involved in Fe transport